MLSAKFDKTKNELTITMPVGTPRPSSKVKVNLTAGMKR